MAVDETLRRMMSDLGRTLSEALANSPEARRALERLRQEGYSPHLCLGPSAAGDGREKIALDLEPEPPRQPVPAARPSFRIHGRDLAFLNSIGIDPTRRPPRRRS